MAPLRRYLRITKHSVLEVRIYLDRPADAEAWLLRPGNPALPRVIQAVRPLVLPKLREEFERVKGKSSSKARKKGVKDVVVENDFEVSIFLTDLSSRHSVLTKQKMFKENPRIQSNSSKLTNWLTTGTSERPVVLTEESTEPVVLREEDEEGVINLDDIPEADPDGGPGSHKRRRHGTFEDAADDASDSDYSFQSELEPRSKRSRRNDGDDGDDDGGDDATEVDDDKKKLALNTSYDGFSIYGRILCLVVKRKGVRNTSGGDGAHASSMENWVSTQAAAEQVGEDENT